MNNRDLSTYVRYSLLVLLLIGVQQIFVPFIQIFQFTPDLVLIFLFVVAVRLGQIPATVFGFAAGLVTDLFVGEIIGISALAKTVSGFIAGYYFDEEKIKVTVRTPKFILITFLCTFIHNILFLLAYIRTVDLDIVRLFLTHGIGSTLYTSVISVFSVLIASRVERRIELSQ